MIPRVDTSGMICEEQTRLTGPCRAMFRQLAEQFPSLLQLCPIGAAEFLPRLRTACRMLGRARIVFRQVAAAGNGCQCVGLEMSDSLPVTMSSNTSAQKAPLFKGASLRLDSGKADLRHARQAGFQRILRDARQPDR